MQIVASAPTATAVSVGGRREPPTGRGVGHAGRSVVARDGVHAGVEHEHVATVTDEGDRRLEPVPARRGPPSSGTANTTTPAPLGSAASSPPRRGRSKGPSNSVPAPCPAASRAAPGGSRRSSPIASEHAVVGVGPGTGGSRGRARSRRDRRRRRGRSEAGVTRREDGEVGAEPDSVGSRPASADWGHSSSARRTGENGSRSQRVDRRRGCRGPCRRRRGRGSGSSATRPRASARAR